MTIISLLESSEYKDWEIISQDKIIYQGKEYYQIGYKKNREGEAGLSQTVLSDISVEDYLWNRIHQCAPVEKLYNEALKEQKENKNAKKIDINLILEKLDSPNGPEYQSSASSNFEEGEIVVKLGKTENEMLSSVIFEITNFKQQKLFEKIDDIEYLKSIDADQYAKETEHIEYNGIQIHHDVIQQAIQTSGWDQEIDEYATVLDSWQTFEDYWKERSDDEHAHYYRMEYDLAVIKSKF
jgi:hypothetical protein